MRVAILLFAAALMSGCTETARLYVKEFVGQEKPVNDMRWRFNDYRITKGKGSVFTDETSTYVVIAKGAQARFVEASGDPAWEQKGSVIHIKGHPTQLAVETTSGEIFAADTLGIESHESQGPAKEYNDTLFEPPVAANQITQRDNQ